MSEFKNLSKEEQASRLAAYAAENKKYGLKDGLFRVTRVSRHADRVIASTKQDCASFGYYVVPVSGVDEADFKPGTFTWVNQLINLNTGKAVVAAMDQLKDDLAQPEVKSVLVSIKYQAKDGYFNVNKLFRQDKSRATDTTPAPEAKTTSKPVDIDPDALEDIPF